MRQPKPFYKKTHSCWYTTVAGKQVRLDPDRDKAWEKFYALMAGAKPKKEKGLTVVELLAEFLDYSKAKHKDSTYEWYRFYLKSFDQYIGNLQIKALKPYHVERWVIKGLKAKNPNTVHGAMRCVQRVMNWAVKSGRLDKTPLAGLERPAKVARDVYLTPEQFKKLVGAIKDKEFLDIITILRETGCRPQEARWVEARHFDRKERCWVIPWAEAKGEKEERVVHLNKKAFEITQRLALKWPKGPIFRDTNGNPWTRGPLNSRCFRLRPKLGFHVCPYTIRHVFATEAIMRGVDLITLAKLMGHKDLRMLEKVYSKVHKRGDHLREALRKATDEDAA